jgi:hypothetical protein
MLSKSPFADCNVSTTTANKKRNKVCPRPPRRCDVPSPVRSRRKTPVEDDPSFCGSSTSFSRDFTAPDSRTNSQTTTFSAASRTAASAPEVGQAQGIEYYSRLLTCPETITFALPAGLPEAAKRVSSLCDQLPIGRPVRVEFETWVGHRATWIFRLLCR